MRYMNCGSAMCSPSVASWRDVQGTQAWVPPMDVRETESLYVIQIDLPGVNKNEIGVALEQNTLTVSAERKPETNEAKALRAERRKGVFRRAMVFPKGVGSGGVNAAYQDGVLTLEVPKREEDKPKNIAVKFN